MEKIQQYRTALDALYFLCLQTGDIFTDSEREFFRQSAVQVLLKYRTVFYPDSDEKND